MRTEPAGHVTIETTLFGYEEQTGAQKQGEKTTGLDTEQRARGKPKNCSGGSREIFFQQFWKFTKKNAFGN